jgi:hypothetical protein
MRPVNEQRIDTVMALVRAELVRAVERFGPMTSPHEGWAVIREEVDELWDEVKTNRPHLAADEAVQVAAMGARYLLDLGINGREAVLLTASRASASDARMAHYLSLDSGRLAALRDTLIEGNGNQVLLAAVVDKLAERAATIG